MKGVHVSRVIRPKKDNKKKLKNKNTKYLMIYHLSVSVANKILQSNETKRNSVSIKLYII